jgi:predicted GNAT superfamily acetyltransferase
VGEIEAETVSGVAVRELRALEDLEQAVAVQREIWGFGDLELVPPQIFVVALEAGGQVLGAFDRERMVGFTLAVPGLKPDGAVFLHSHMLGVLPEYRDRHIGRALKLEQRRAAIARGIELIEWTFDPLELKNAHFNIERLGVVVRRYVLNKYGTTTSPLHGPLPTDRCVAEWWLRKPRPAGLAVEARIEVPADIGELRQQRPEEARRIQAAISGQFVECFGRGLVVTGFTRAERAGAYLLARWPSE